jgi:hypothetical protein
MPAKVSLLEEQPASNRTEAAATAMIDLDLDKEELLSKGFLKFTLQSSLKPDFLPLQRSVPSELTFLVSSR